MSDLRFLEQEKISKLLIKFAIPSIVGLLAHAFYNVCDRIIVGQGVGTEALSGVTVVFPTIMVRFAFTILVGAGSATIMSIYLGEKKKKQAEKVLTNGFFLSLFLGAIFCFIGVFYSNEILKTFGVREPILSQANIYMKVMFSGAIFMFLHFLLFCAIRVDGRPNYSMGMICFAAILNIILDYVFVFPLGMGIKGAAIATVISEFLEFLIGLYYFLSNKSFMKLNFKISWIKFDILKNIIKFGFPPFIIDLTFGVQNLFLNIQLLKYGGDLAVAAMGVVFAAITFVVLPVIGLCDGMQPIVGYNFGAKKPKRIKKTLIKAIIFSTILGVFGQALVQLFSEDVASLFTKDKELIKVAQTGLLLYLAMMFTAGIQNSLSSFLPCIEKAKSATFFSIIRQAIIFLGLLYILPRFFGLKGVWLTMPVADFLGTIITIIWIAYELKNLNKMKEKK